MGTRQSRGDSAPTSEGTPKPTPSYDETVDFINFVQEKFEDQNEKIEEFLQIMKDYQAKRISPAEGVKRIQEMFEGEKELLLGFNKFVPTEYETHFPPEMPCSEIRQSREDSAPSSKRTGTYEDAQKYIELVKEKLRDQNEKLEEFFQIIMDYHSKRISIFEMINEMKELLKGDRELILGFNIFLPKEYEAQIPQEKELNAVNGEEKIIE